MNATTATDAARAFQIKLRTKGFRDHFKVYDYTNTLFLCSLVSLNPNFYIKMPTDMQFITRLRKMTLIIYYYMQNIFFPYFSDHVEHNMLFL